MFIGCRSAWVQSHEHGWKVAKMSGQDLIRLFFDIARQEDCHPFVVNLNPEWPHKIQAFFNSMFIGPPEDTPYE